MSVGVGVGRIHRGHERLLPILVLLLELVQVLLLLLLLLLDVLRLLLSRHRLQRGGSH